MIKIPKSVEWINIHAAASVAADSGLSETAEHPDYPVNQIYGSEEPTTICERMLDTIKGIIFDFDGTLYDHSNIAFRMISANPIATIRIWKERLVRSRFQGRDFLSPENFYRAFFIELGKACLRPPGRVRNWYFNHYMPRMIRILKKYYQPRHGVKELLQKLGSSESPIKTAVYSDYPLLKERIEALGLEPSDNIKLYGPDFFGAQKPAARPFLQIAKSFGLHPEEILVIGDREDTDGLGAYNAGMRFFCLETGLRRYYRLDPYRRKQSGEMQGPTLLMYAGAWDGLIKLLFRRIS